jgi:hypothetical protein
MTGPVVQRLREEQNEPTRIAGLAVGNRCGDRADGHLVAVPMAGAWGSEWITRWFSI